MEGMARRIFDSSSPADTTIGGDDTALGEPWVVKDLDLEANLVDHLLSLFSSQGALKPTAQVKAMPRSSFTMKDAGKYLPGSFSAYLGCHRDLAIDAFVASSCRGLVCHGCHRASALHNRQKSPVGVQ
jgi:hypothetical protein